MIRIPVALRLLAAVAAAASVAGAASAAPDELLVSFNRGADHGPAHRAGGGAVVDTIPAIGVDVVRVPAGRSMSQAARAYRGAPGVAAVGPNADLHASYTPNDPYFAPWQWNFRAIGMETAWDRTVGGNATARASVAILDTGVAYENYGTKFAIAPDLADSKYAKFLSARAYDYVNNDSHANDDNGHGTHVAGTIAGTTGNGTGVAGIAHGAQILPIKVLNSQGSGSYSAVAKGILRAAGYNVAGSALDGSAAVNVISMSLGGGYDTSGAMDRAMQAAYDRGVTIVAASGNSNLPNAEYPANADVSRPSGSSFYYSVIGVGATGYFDAIRAPYRAPYSNYGPGTDIFAPGGDSNADINGDGRSDGIVQQTFVNGRAKNFGYYIFQGTSMATPHVSAVAAMIEAQNPSYTPAQVEARLLGTANPSATLGAPVLNADRATDPNVTVTQP